jgi:hypothetical protein
MTAKHHELTVPHLAAYFSGEDPSGDSDNFVTAGKLWVDLSLGPPYQLKVRKTSDSGWDNVGARIDTTGGGGGGGGGTTTTDNAALTGAGASATASSSNDVGTGTADEPPVNSIDANDTTLWGTHPLPTGETPVGHWLRIDLGAVKDITHYRVVQGPNPGHQATGSKIQTSADGTTGWTDQVTLDAVVDTGQTAFTAPISARYFRLLCIGAPILPKWDIATFALYTSTTTAGPGSLLWRGDWDNVTAYVTGDIVGNLGSSYIATSDNTGNDPATDDGSHWALLAAKGADGDDGTDGTSFTWRGAWLPSRTTAAPTPPSSRSRPVATSSRTRAPPAPNGASSTSSAPV